MKKLGMLIVVIIILLGCESNDNIGSSQETDYEKPIITAYNLRIGASTYDTNKLIEKVTASDSVDGDLTDQIEYTVYDEQSYEITDYTRLEVGIYTIIYQVEDQAGNRNEVTKTLKITDDQDLEPPSLSLVKPVEISIFDLQSIDSKLLENVRAIDTMDGNITDQIRYKVYEYDTVITSDAPEIMDLQTLTLGEYIVKYTVSDSAGNESILFDRLILYHPDQTPGIKLSNHVIVHASDITLYHDDQNGEWLWNTVVVTDGYGNVITGDVTIDLTIKEQESSQIYDHSEPLPVGIYDLIYNISVNSELKGTVKKRLTILEEPVLTTTTEYYDKHGLIFPLLLDEHNKITINKDLFVIENYECDMDKVTITIDAMEVNHTGQKVNPYLITETSFETTYKVTFKATDGDKPIASFTHENVWVLDEEIMGVAYSLINSQNVTINKSDFITNESVDFGGIDLTESSILTEDGLELIDRYRFNIPFNDYMPYDFVNIRLLSKTVNDSSTIYEVKADIVYYFNSATQDDRTEKIQITSSALPDGSIVDPITWTYTITISE